MPEFHDITGLTFGRLIVLEYVGLSYYDKTLYRCRCQCGKERIILAGSLRSGRTISCGCYGRHLTGAKSANFKHGHSTGYAASPEYRTWAAMKTRCTNPNYVEYANYGGRGITVCERWMHDFATFLADMGPKPSSAHSIDRIDNDGNYEPSNCRWATWIEQNNNRRAPIKRALINK